MKTLLLAFLLASWTVMAQPVCPTPAQLDSDLTAAAQGSILDAGVNPLVCPEVAMQQTWTGGSLIFSDSPESPTVKGKLYEDSFAATAGTVYNRLFVNHANGRAAKMKIAVLIKNTGSSSGTLTIRQKGVAGPSLAYVTVGKLAFQRWLQSTAGSGVSVGAGATVKLDAGAFEQNMTTGQLISGIYDISMTQPYKVTICSLDTGDNSLTVCPGLAVLSRDVHDRGTFPNADKIYDTSTGTDIDTLDGVQQLPSMFNTANDTDAIGVDATDGSAATLHGNIGVLYRMHLLLKSSDGQNMGIIINPRGGYWGTALNVMPGLLAGGVFLCPASIEGISDNTKACVEGRYTPGGGLTVWLQAMMTSGSNAPLRVIFVPH